jgi:hypothetical protein
MQEKKELPTRETGNWSGKQDKTPQSRDNDDKYPGQREYTELPRNRSDKARRNA